MVVRVVRVERQRAPHGPGGTARLAQLQVDLGERELPLWVLGILLKALFELPQRLDHRGLRLLLLGGGLPLGLARSVGNAGRVGTAEGQVEAQRCRSHRQTQQRGQDALTTTAACCGLRRFLFELQNAAGNLGPGGLGGGLVDQTAAEVAVHFAQLGAVDLQQMAAPVLGPGAPDHQHERQAARDQEQEEEDADPKRHGDGVFFASQSNASSLGLIRGRRPPNKPKRGRRGAVASFGPIR